MNESQTARQETALGAFQRWTRFAIGVAAILVFAFVVIPWLQSFGTAREIKRVVLEKNIDAGALFYSDIPESSEAEMWIRDSLKRAKK